MKFTLRYWYYWFSAFYSKAIELFAIVTVITLLGNIHIIASEGFSILIVVEIMNNVICSGFTYLFLSAIAATIKIWRRHIPLRIYDEKGFCTEYLEAYERACIINRAAKPEYYIEFARIHHRLGNLDTAAKLLNSIRVPENNEKMRVKYLFEYMIIAAKMGDAGFAEDIWKKNELFLQHILGGKRYNRNIRIVFLMLIYKEITAGRYERAYETCMGVLNSGCFEKRKSCIIDYLVIRIYLLKMLGKESEVRGAHIEFINHTGEGWRPLLRAERNEVNKDADKALRGELPL